MSSAGRCIARSTSSGMVVGPGIARNSRPARSVIFLIPCWCALGRDAAKWQEIQAGTPWYRIKPVLARSESDQAIQPFLVVLDCLPEPVIARAFARPVGPSPVRRSKESDYRRVSRQPAASASSTEQNQRVPLLIFILICAYQRLVGV